MLNEELYKKALEAINALFSDTSVSVAECRKNLETLVEEINILLDSLPED